MKKDLKQLYKTSKPSKQFEKKLWMRLDAELPRPLIRHKIKRLMNVPAIATAAVLLLGGTGSYAYASPNVVPDSPLYGVKAGIENVEEGLKFSPEAKAKFHARMAERRGKEMEHAPLERHPELREAIMDELGLSEEELESAHENEELREAIKERLDAFREEHADEIEAHMEEMRAQATERFESLVEEGKIPEDRIDEMRERLESGDKINFKRLRHRHMQKMSAEEFDGFPPRIPAEEVEQ